MLVCWQTKLLAVFICVIHPSAAFCVHARPDGGSLSVVASATSPLAPDFDLDSSTVQELDALDLDSILAISIVSASKHAEPLFISNLAATVVTRAEIERAGVLSVPEALRLVPGMVVREATPGYHDVHLRGYDAVPPSVSMQFSQNRTTLVMIDGRIAFNDVLAGTFWGTLPVTISDIERIEVVRGPTAALYGPNASAGVIHVITRKPQNQGFTFRSQIRTGSAPGSTTGPVNLAMADVSADYFEGSFWLRTTAAAQKRMRQNSVYYGSGPEAVVFRSPREMRFYDGRPLSLLGDPDEIYPYPALAIESASCSVNGGYKPNDVFALSTSASVKYSRPGRCHRVTMRQGPARPFGSSMWSMTRRR